MNINLQQGALSLIASAVQGAMHVSDVAGSSNSLTSLVKGLQVSPYTIVDDSLEALDFMPDVMQSLQSLFTAIWLQAVEVIGSPESAQAIQKLDVINPQRDSSWKVLTERIRGSFSTESMYWDPKSYLHGLPTKESYTVRKAALEAEANGGRFKEEKKPDETMTTSHDDRFNKLVHESANLSVGKMVAINIPVKKDNGEITKLTFHVAIRLMAVFAPASTVALLVSDKSQAASFKDRLYDLRKGRIDLLDFLFCRDLLKERKRQMLRDRNGVYAEVRSRQLEHKKAGILSGTISAAEASNLIVLSQSTVNQVQMQTGLDITDYSDRQKFFENTAAMTLVVVDPAHMRVHFYIEGSKLASKMGIADIKASNRKGQGPDLMDLFENLRQGQPVRL